MEIDVVVVQRYLSSDDLPAARSHYIAPLLPDSQAPVDTRTSMLGWRRRLSSTPTG